MDFLLKRKPILINARIPMDTKEFISQISEMRGMNESQYINLALENQIKSDIGQFNSQKQQLTPKP